LANNQTLEEILKKVKSVNDEALAEEAMLKELEATALDDEALANGTLDPQTAAQLWQRRQQATEMRRQLIKDRIKLAGADNVQFLHARPKPTISDESNKRVAVYTRVSTKSLDQTSSIENQARYYTEKINKNPNWELVKIYSDEGKSGTSTKWRPDFLQMMKDAKEQKIDMILCASVSRFARNVTDCLDQINKLRTMNPSHPVGVYFETENIYTLDENSGQNLDMQALLADWESRTKSRRMILSYDQRICTCQFPVSDLLGYRHTKTGKLVMIPEEAKTVRLIFLAYLCGYSYTEIAEILTEKKRTTLKGRTDWNAGMVKNVMMNERRWGDLQARKTIVIDYKAKKTAKNTNQEREGAFVEQHHIGIVSPEIARAVKYLFPNGKKIGGNKDVYVIPSGGLKGFVNINPAWQAINNDTFLALCCSVYDDNELEQIKHDSKVFNGEAHSNILQMEFSGYQIPYGIYFLTSKMPSMTISKNKIKFNKACHDRFDDCNFIEVLYHPILQMVVIRACDEETPTSIRWKTEDGKVIFEISSKAFSESLFERMKWIKEYSFQFRGLFRKRGNSKVLFFSLEEPRIHIGKKQEQKDANNNEEIESPIKFIPYKSDDEKEEISTPSYAYPAEWQNIIGLSQRMRERRDFIADNITESDLQVCGTCAINPLIGELPTKQEVLEELEDLLISM